MIVCVCAQLHFNIRNETAVQLDKKNSGLNMCQNQYKSSQGGKVTTLWNQQIQTGRTIPNNKPYIIIRYN